MQEEELRRIFAQNLRFLLRAKDYTQERFIEEFNEQFGTKFNRVSVSDWTNAKKMPRPIVIENIGEFFGYDAGFLLSEPERDSMNALMGLSIQQDTASGLLGLNSQQQDTASRLLGLSDKQLNLVNRFLDGLLDNGSNEQD